MTRPILLVVNTDKKIYDVPDFTACGMAGDRIYILNTKDLIPLPPTSEIFTLPDRNPIGFNTRYQVLPEFNAVAAFLPPGYTQLLTPAYKERTKARILPLFSYTPVAWYKNRFFVPAMRIDYRRAHDIRYMDMGKVLHNIKSFKKSKNRLIKHLETCALTYKCPNAINFFLTRYECPLPVSPICNSRCLGCISFQPYGTCPPTQPRIEFIPTPDEIAEVALIHIKNVKYPVLSFGQGCEGEPLLKADIINEAIKIIRKKTHRGTININTNASIPFALKLLCETGLDSIRVSLNSVREEFYTKYYKPQGYTLRDVIESIHLAKRYKKFVSINYLIMPGFTDEESEFNELVKFLKKTKIDMIQWRNLNYDPHRYFEKLGIKESKKLLGIKTIINILKEKFPNLRYGYFNLHLQLH